MSADVAGDDLRVFSMIERRARQVVLDGGGSLSHHHGVGKLRQEWFKQQKGPAELDLLRQVKKLLDPDNVFGVGNFGEL